MTDQFSVRDRRIDALLKLGRYIGLVGLLGGLGALTAMWWYGPAPEGPAQWHLLLNLTRAVFIRCMFAGIIILAVIGSMSWWRHRKQFHGQRWFKVMMISVLITIPALHLWARWTMLKIRAAVEAGDFTAAAALGDTMAVAYTISLIILLVIAAVGIIKPGFGQARE
jgi:hypothetical protein